ncbi:hypothetical protein [Halomarina rubra]|uniref:Uncharacterized protein n=1 Tax=Halomarina rubra TaxID=2071873 RepID=A0ABD6B1P4_9EURY|nr:hypothetical protein [Halomarina rubra]
MVRAREAWVLLPTALFSAAVAFVELALGGFPLTPEYLAARTSYNCYHLLGSAVIYTASRQWMANLRVRLRG